MNTVIFNGHWETFAGVNYKISDNLNMSVDVINLLGAKGAKGKVDSADTIGKDIDLTNLVLAGSYIIPFTVNMSVTCRF